MTKVVVDYISKEFTGDANELLKDIREVWG